jgi:transcriptional regulator GlxA family with amidase domain
MHRVAEESAPGVRALIARVEAAVLPDEPDATVRVVDLARAAGVSTRTVFRAFARHYGAPPITHLRRSRLERVRRHLLAAAPGETVTSVALEGGFSHLGRFAVYYRQCFGERPSETLRRGHARRQALASAGLAS